MENKKNFSYFKLSTKQLIAILSVSASAFMSVLVETSMNVTFPRLIKEMDVPLDTIQWITTGYLISSALIITLSSFLKQRFTNLKLFIAANLLFLIGNIICMLSNAFPILLLGRIIQAGCAGISLPLQYNLIFDMVPRRKVGYYVGLALLVVMVAPALGPSFGGFILEWLGWRAIFAIPLPITLIILIIGISTIKQYSKLKKVHFDWIGLILLTIIFVILGIGINNLGRPNLISWTFLVGILLFVFSSTFFIVHSKKTNNPLFNIFLFKKPLFIYSFITYSLLQFTNMGANFLLPNYAQYVYHASSFIAGFILFPGSLISAIFQPYFGRLLDQHGARLPLTIGNTLIAVSTLIFIIVHGRLGIWFAVIFYIFFSIGRSMDFSNSLTNGLKEFQGKQRADANALYSTGQQYAGSIGTTVLATIVAAIKLPGTSQTTNITISSEFAIGVLFIIALINFALMHLTFKHENHYDVSH